MALVVRIDVSAEPSAVWSALVDVQQWPKWTDSIDSLELLQPGPLRLGSRARVKQPGMPVAVWQVTEMSDGRCFTWESRSPGVVTIGRHEVEAKADGGSCLILEVEQRGLLGGAVRLLMRGRVRRFMQMEANGLKACSEGMAGS